MCLINSNIVEIEIKEVKRNSDRKRKIKNRRNIKRKIRRSSEKNGKPRKILGFVTEEKRFEEEIRKIVA